MKSFFSKLMLRVFVRFVLPIVLIIVGSVFAYNLIVYKVFREPDYSLEELMHNMFTAVEQGSGEKVTLIKEYEKKIYDVMLADVRNDKRMFYILMVALALIFVVIFLNLIKLLTALNVNILMFPERYEVVSKEDAEILRHLKRLTGQKTLMKENVNRLLTHSESDA
jgi:hypothetical protein